MLAWMVGMPLAFLGIDAAQLTGSLLLGGLVLAGVLLAMGALVGSIRGTIASRDL